MYLQPAQSSRQYISLRDLSVLVLDDNANTRTLIGEVLRGLGVKKTHRVATCAEAHAVLKTHAIDVILADIKIDGEDGLAFVRGVRADRNPKVANAAVVMVSSHATEARVMEAGVIGADGFLSKPFSVNSFARRFSEAIHARAAAPPLTPSAPQVVEV